MNSQQSKIEASDGTGHSGLRPESVGWPQYIWLVYLGFLFTPLLNEHNRWGRWLPLTVLSVVVFVLLYRDVSRQLRRNVVPRPGQLPRLLAMVALGYALAPFNDQANIYIIYFSALTAAVYTSMPFVASLVALALGGTRWFSQCWASIRSCLVSRRRCASRPRSAIT
jgi:hypothetical protein